MNDNNILILKHQDIEALYVNGELIEQGDTIGEGMNTEAMLTMLSYFKVSPEHTFIAWVDHPIDESYIYRNGCLPNELYYLEMEYRTEANRIGTYW